MRPHSVLLAPLALVIAISSACAADGEPGADAPPWMTESGLKAAFAGKTLDGHYANAVTFTESYLANGRIDYREPGRALAGRWSVEAGTFCTIYDTSATGGCYRVRQMSANCFEFYFVARDEAEVNVRPGRPSWTARAWYADARSTCQEGANV